MLNVELYLELLLSKLLFNSLYQFRVFLHTPNPSQEGNFVSLLTFKL